MAVNCDQLRKEDILHMLEKVLYEFPLQQMEFYIPKWVELLADDHPLKAELLQKIREMQGKDAPEGCSGRKNSDCQSVCQPDTAAVDGSCERYGEGAD